MYRIESGKPIPAKRPCTYPWPDMGVGDSFEDTENPDSARAAAWMYAKRHKMRFVSRKTDRGVRIWRTA